MVPMSLTLNGSSFSSASLGFAGLAVEFAVHEEIGDEHDQADAQEHHAEGHGTADVDMAAELGEIRREDHAGRDAEARQGHLGAHGEGRLPALEPLDDTAAHRDARHFAAAAEDHESDGRQLGRGRHVLVEREDIVDEAHAGVPVQVIGEPGLEAGPDERIADGVPFDEAADEHHGTRKHGREPDPHLVEDDTREDEEEYEYVEEYLGALHRSEGLGIPPAGGFHQVLDRGQDIHENVRAEHRQSQEQQRCPPHRCRIAQRFLDGISHIDRF